MPSWQKLPVFAKIRESQLIQLQRVYQQCVIMENVVNTLKQGLELSADMTPQMETFLEASSKLLSYLDNQPSTGLFPDYEPALLYTDPQPPNNCIIEVFIQHCEFVVRVHGLGIKKDVSSPTVVNTPELFKPTVNRPASTLSAQPKPYMLAARSLSAFPTEPSFLIEWGCGDGMMGYPKGTRQVVIQNKFNTVSYMYDGYIVTVLAKREVHITSESLDHIYTQIRDLQTQWAHTLNNIKQLIEC